MLPSAQKRANFIEIRVRRNKSSCGHQNDSNNEYKVFDFERFARDESDVLDGTKTLKEQEDFFLSDSFFADEKKNKQKNTQHKLKVVAKNSFHLLGIKCYRNKITYGVFACHLAHKN